MKVRFYSPNFFPLGSDLENVTPSGHKKQLSELAEKDPEFYKFLKQQDADLLQFDESDPEVDGMRPLI